MQKNSVEVFVDRVRATLNQHLLWTILIWSAAIGAATVVVLGLGWIVQGYAVPRILYLITAAFCTMGAVGMWAFRRHSHRTASRFTDEHFGLKDAVTSCRNFASDGRSGGYFDMQSKQTKERVEGLDSAAIPFAFPARTAAVAIVLGVTAIVLAFQSPSQAVLDQRAFETATMDQTKIMNRELEELVEELEKDIKDENERELLEPNKLREWVNELKETNDQKEALRQYAKLEQKIQKAASRLRQKQDEQYLERAAKELEKGEESKQLAKSLKQKKYDDAAKELAKMRPESANPLNEQRKQLARLKAVAKRMNAAAKKTAKRQPKSAPRSSQNQQAVAKNSENDANKNSNASQAKSQTAEQKSGEQERGEQNSREQEQSVEQLVENLNQSLEEFDKQLTRAEMQLREKGECDQEKLEACNGKVGQCMGRLGDKLARMGMKKNMQARLMQLCKACSQCQSSCAGLNPGGKEAGWGSSDTRRNERDALVDNGQFTQLKGLKGLGPSITAIEEAEDGTGISSARRVAVSRDYQRQLESFVDREDVPDDVKSGVRNYFEMIHQSE